MDVVNLCENRIEEKTFFEPSCVALGNFDGVHTGHKMLLRKCCEEAGKNGLVPMVWTFSVHPFLCMGKEISTLTTNEEKNEIFYKNGIKIVCYEQFENVRNMPGEDFVEEVLIKKLNVRHIVCGYNFRFGKNGQADVETLKKVSEKNGIIVTVIPQVTLRKAYSEIKGGFKDFCTDIPDVTVTDEPVNSTCIRNCLESGDMPKASLMLGRFYSFSSEIVHGKKLGRLLGARTINQYFPPNKTVPSRGVYAVLVKTEDKVYKGVSNVGIRPTFDDGNELNCETHILNADCDLYGKKAEISFCKKLRNERKFETSEQLSEAVESDIKSAKKFFGMA